MEIRVLHIVTYMGRGGLETMLMNYYRNINRKKVQFDFLVHRDFEADYDQEILDMGGRIYHISRLIPWSSAYRKELKKFLKEHSEYRIVQVHQDCLSSVALQCAKAVGVPIRIAHSHSAGAVKNLKYPIKLYYMKKIPQYATKLFACGQQAGDWMFGNNNYQIIRNAIDIKKYQYSEIKNIEVREKMDLKENIVVGHVGNFTEAKNHLFLLQIFREIIELEPNARLLLIGDGEKKEFLEKKVRELGLNDTVIFLGRRSDVNELMQCMNVFVFPSLYEGLPVTMIEAQAAGVQCIISDQVSEECVVTQNLVSKMKLTDAPMVWAKKILEKAKLPRSNHAMEIEKAGYDIGKSAKELEAFYLKE